MAAALVVGFAIGTGGTGGTGGDSMHTLARTVAADHALDRHTTIETDDAMALAEHVRGRLPFEYALPDLLPLAVAGGRCCSVGGEPVAFTLLQSGTEPVSLFQFVPESLGVSADHAPKHFRIDDVPGSAGPVFVRVWCEGGAGYALVASERSALPE